MEIVYVRSHSHSLLPSQLPAQMKQIKQIRELGLAVNLTEQNWSCIIIYITHKDENGNGNGNGNSPGLSEDGLLASEDVKKSICRFWNADFDFP